MWVCLGQRSIISFYHMGLRDQTEFIEHQCEPQDSSYMDYSEVCFASKMSIWLAEVTNLTLLFLLSLNFTCFIILF